MKAQLRSQLVASAAHSLREDIDQVEEEFDQEELEEGRMVELSEELGAIISGTGKVSTALIHAGEADDAEVLLVPTVERNLRESVQPEVERALDPLDFAHTQELSLALAKWLSHRPTAALQRFGPKLNPIALGDAASAELAEILARLWREAAQDGNDEVDAGLAQLAKLRREGAGIGVERLSEEIRASLAAPLVSEEEVARRRADFGRLEELTKENLLLPQEAADLVLAGVQTILAETPPPGLESSVAGVLEGAIERAGADASPPELERAREGLGESPWIAGQSPLPEILQLQIVAALSRGESKPTSPIEPAQITELAEAHGERFIPGLATWLTAFRPKSTVAAKALQPYLDSDLTSRLAEAVAAYRKRLNPAARYRLIRGLIEWPSNRRPSLRLLRQMGIEDADAELVTAAILKRYDQAHNNKDREYALKLWKAFAPAVPGTRRKLIRKVFIPLVGVGAGGYEIAARYLELCVDPPHGTKEELLKALGKPPDRKRGKRMGARMAELGLAPAKKSWFKRLGG